MLPIIRGKENLRHHNLGALHLTDFYTIVNKYLIYTERQNSTNYFLFIS